MGGALLKIVYVVESLDVSGGVRVIAEHAKGLAARGHEVEIVTRWDPGDWMRLDVPVKVVPAFDESTLPRADVHLATWYETVVPTVRARRAPLIFHFCQGYEAPHPHLWAQLEAIHEAYRQAIPKILVSPHLRTILEPLYPGPYHVIPQVIRTADFAPSRSGEAGPRTPPTVGVVGPFEAPLKGVAVALRALRALQVGGRNLKVHRASQVVLSRDEDELCRADEYGCRIPADRMLEWYRALDVLVHPSFDAEGFPLPPLEAMASGVPVVLTRIPSFDPLPRNAAGWADPGDADAMAHEVTRLLDDPGLWSRRRRSGLAAVAAFAPERAVEALERLFDGYLVEKRSS
jgi:glycosyltransferase involved in cell wall biosynthesis